MSPARRVLGASRRPHLAMDGRCGLKALRRVLGHAKALFAAATQNGIALGELVGRRQGVPEQTATSPQETVGRLLEHLDALNIDGIVAMLTADAQSVDEITRSWTRGRAAIEAYMSQLKGSVSDVHSQMSDVQEQVWGDVGLVTFVLDQIYTLEGQSQTISAPTSIVFRRHDGDWKIALIHTVPLPD